MKREKSEGNDGILTEAIKELEDHGINLIHECAKKYRALAHGPQIGTNQQLLSHCLKKTHPKTVRTTTLVAHIRKSNYYQWET